MVYKGGSYHEKLFIFIKKYLVLFWMILVFYREIGGMGNFENWIWANVKKIKYL